MKFHGSCVIGAAGIALFSLTANVRALPPQPSYGVNAAAMEPDLIVTHRKCLPRKSAAASKSPQPYLPLPPAVTAASPYIKDTDEAPMEFLLEPSTTSSSAAPTVSPEDQIAEPIPAPQEVVDPYTSIAEPQPSLVTLPKIVQPVTDIASPEPGTQPSHPAALSWTDRNAMLVAHNLARAKYNIAPLVYNESVEIKAGEYAFVLADQGCILEHGGNEGLGQNLYSTFTSSGRAFASMEEIVDGWMDEDISPGAYDHATQILWYSTTSVGCGYAWGSTPKWTSCEVIVCDYYPPGNWVGLAYDGTPVP